MTAVSVATAEAVEVLAELQRRGVRLYVEDTGRPRLVGPVSALPAWLVALCRQHKATLVSFASCELPLEVPG
jgi:hypothetical protein